MHILKKVWSGWKIVLKLVGNFQASVLLTLTYVILVPPIAIPYKILADPLRIRNRHAAFLDASSVDLTSLEAARRQ